MREPTIAETVEWVGGASKQHLVQFIQACGSDAALVEAGIKGRAPLSKKVMKKKKHTVLQTEARKVLAAAWASAWSGAGGKGSSWSALDAKEGWLFKAGEKNSRLKRRHFRCEPGSKTIIYSAPVRGALPGKDDDLKVGKKKGEIDLRTAAQLIEGFNGQFLIATTTGRIFDLHVLPPSKAMDPHRTATLYAESAKWLRFLSEETGLNVYGWSDSPSEFPLIAACTRRESIALIKAAGGVLPGGQGAADAAAAAGRRRSELSIAPKLIPLPERVEEEEDDEREVLDGGGARAHLASPFARLSGRTVSPRLAIGSSDSAEPSTAAVLEGASSSAAASPSPSPSLAYLSPLNLEQYAPAFDDAGGDDPRDLLAMDAAALVAEFRMKKLHANRLRVWLDTLAAPESGGGLLQVAIRSPWATTTHWIAPRSTAMTLLRKGVASWPLATHQMLFLLVPRPTALRRRRRMVASWPSLAVMWAATHRILLLRPTALTLLLLSLPRRSRSQLPPYCHLQLMPAVWPRQKRAPRRSWQMIKLVHRPPKCTSHRRKRVARAVLQSL